MAIIYEANVKNARLNIVSQMIGNTGVLEIGDSSFATVLARVPLDNTAANAAVNGVLTFRNFPRSDTFADGTGIAANARILTANSGLPTSNTIISGLTVGTSASDIVLDSTNITAGQTITINSAVITHA